MPGEAYLLPAKRDHSAPLEFDPLRVSPSRVNTYLFCGEAFRRRYIDGEPAQVSGSAALFGLVIHDALEKWALNRSQDLVTLTSQAWVNVTRDTPVAAFLREYQAISIECMKAEKAAAVSFEKRNPGKKSMAPRMTKEFKESAAAQKLNALVARWLPKLNAESPWKFTERDPLPTLYDESLIKSKKYAAQWNDLPASLHTEFGFSVPWEGFTLSGYIDTIEPVLTKRGKLRGYGIGDYKTYRADPSGAKDWRQGVMYDIAFEFLCREGVLPFDARLPRWVIFDYFRLLKRVDYVITAEDRRVCLNDLKMYRDAVGNGVFLPAQKNTNPDFCDYPENCCMKTRGEGTGCRGELYPNEEAT